MVERWFGNNGSTIVQRERSEPSTTAQRRVPRLDRHRRVAAIDHHLMAGDEGAAAGGEKERCGDQCDGNGEDDKSGWSHIVSRVDELWGGYAGCVVAHVFEWAVLVRGRRFCGKVRTGRKRSGRLKALDFAASAISSICRWIRLRPKKSIAPTAAVRGMAITANSKKVVMVKFERGCGRQERPRDESPPRATASECVKCERRGAARWRASGAWSAAQRTRPHPPRVCGRFGDQCMPARTTHCRMRQQ